MVLAEPGRESRVVREFTPPAWKEGRNAIVVLWDENDYSFVPNTNRVLLIVDTNYGARLIHSAQPYTDFSLLESLEAARKGNPTVTWKDW